MSIIGVVFSTKDLMDTRIIENVDKLSSVTRIIDTHIFELGGEVQRLIIRILHLELVQE